MKVNLKPYVTETLLETEALQRLGLGAPDEALMLVFCKEKLLQLVENVRDLVRRNDQFRMNIPLLFVPLMRPSLLRLDQAFLPALCDLTWTSVEVPTFCESMAKMLHELEIFLQEVKDIKEARIEETFYQIANTLLLRFPKEPVTGAQLLELNTEFVRQTAHELETRSFSAERATLELITKLLERIPVMDISDDDPVKFEWLDRSVLLKTTDDSKMNPISPNAAFKDMESFAPFELETVHFDCMELFCYFNNKNLESLVRATRKTFDELKARAFVSANEANKMPPLYLTSLQLKIPDVVLVPPLEELQRNFNRLVCVVGSGC
ncbi:hypothetical protein R5R35_000326 [Gryllus longicercus]|uniref:Dynein heavy chain tail domain-containing protein n=1 Tax=Gryllus longicercus TaxID=2509291 RepID=A0AAN9ZGW8_9ORTH